MTSTHTTKDNLEREFQNLMKSANSLINAATNCLGGESGRPDREQRTESPGLRHAAQDMAERAGQTVQTVRKAAGDMTSDTLHSLRDRYDTISGTIGGTIGLADRMVRDHPYMAVGAVFVLGATVAAMLRKR